MEENFKTMLSVEYKTTKDGEKVLDWNFGKNVNSYFLLGVLDVIKDELKRDIENKSDDYFRE